VNINQLHRTLFVATFCAYAFVNANAQAPASSCVVIQTLGSQTAWRSDQKACATRLSPASTFKIPHALVALETGVVQPDTIERWDGTRHPDQPEWDKDHTVLSAMRPSVLWFFQRIAPRIGAARMLDWLTKMRYGNADTSGEITAYWINGVLRVSPDEQVLFLRQFYAGTLPIAAERQRLVRDALVQRPGTVQNARGIHALDGSWPDGVRLNSKTGATRTANGQGVSWLVGSLTVAGADHVFASAVWRDGAAVDGLDATRLAVKIFIERGLIKP
jgi:beta-lactamase class D